MNSGILITFEGTEGAGKSTLIREVARQLKRLGYTRIVQTREPGGTPVAEKIRNVILEKSMDPRAELFLYEAARAEHVAKTILPALKKNSIVLCDRYADSSLAYQAHARGLPWKEVKALNHIATQGLRPHLTVLLDIDPARGLKRAQDKNRFEDEGVLFQKKVRQGFLKAAREEPKRWIRISARGTPEVLGGKVVTEILNRLAKKSRGK